MLKGPWQASMGTLTLGSLPSFPVPLRRWCWWDRGGRGPVLIWCQLPSFWFKPQSWREPMLGESPWNACGPDILGGPLLAQGRVKRQALWQPTVLCAVHTGWFSPRHCRYLPGCGVGGCPCTHGNLRPVSCFHLLLGSTTQMHLAGLRVATSDAQLSCFHGNHIRSLLISGLSSVLNALSFPQCIVCTLYLK